MTTKKTRYIHNVSIQYRTLFWGLKRYERLIIHSHNKKLTGSEIDSALSGLPQNAGFVFLDISSFEKDK